MAQQRRAMSDAQKLERRAAILVVVWQMFTELPYAEITMSAVAERAGLAKGTLYLYFTTKEQLFLALQEQQLQDWFNVLNARLRAATGADGPEIAALFCGTLVERPELTRLLAMLHSTLEQNIDLATAIAFKEMLLVNMAQTGALLEERLPFLLPGQGAQLLLHAHALVIGLRHLTDPSPVVREVLARPGMEPFVIDFAREFTAAFSALILGQAQAKA